MAAFPFTRTRSDSSFPLSKSTHITDKGCSAKPSHIQPSPFSSSTSSELTSFLPSNDNSSLFSLPSSLKINKSFTSGFDSFKSDSPEFSFPFNSQPHNLNISQETHPTSLSDLNIQNTSFPAFRSQSAVFYHQINSNTQPSLDTTQHVLAMRRPPASFGGSKKPEKKSFFPSFSNAIRSVPASRCNSEEFAELWNELEKINQESDGSKSRDNSTHFSSPLSNYKSSVNCTAQEEYVVPHQFNAGFLEELNQSSFDGFQKNPLHSEELLKIYKEKDNFPILIQHNGVSKLSVTSPLTSPQPNSTEAKEFLTAVTSPNQNQFLEANNPKANRRKNTVSSPRTTVPCRYFVLGQCSKGANCHFFHSNQPQNQKREKNQSSQESLWSQQISYPKQNSAQESISTTARAGVPNRTTRWTSEVEKPAPISPESRFIDVCFKDFIGSLYSLCQDQPGCRYLQKTLEEDNSEYNNAIYEEISPHFSSLLTDPFGNYLSQKLMECAKSTQRIRLLRIAFNDLARISLNSHGTRAVQKIIELLAVAEDPGANDAIKLLTEALEPHVVALIKDSNGNHVIQKCIVLFSSQNNQFVYNAISKNCLDVATHKHGCCVIQRCFDNASFLQKEQLAIVIASNALSLVQDPFGNYVVQYVIRIENCKYTNGLIYNFLGHMPRLSSQKFSSNVIEKCIQAAEPSLRNKLIEEIVNSRELEQLLQDSYANYVIQTCLDFAEPTLRGKLIDRVKPILLTARSSPYIKRIQARILDGESEMLKNQENTELTSLGSNIKKVSMLALDNVQDSLNQKFLSHPHDFNQMRPLLRKA